MKISLTNEEKENLEQLHAKERDRKVADRIKAVLLSSENWTNRQISQALRIQEITIASHLADFVNLKKLEPENGGSKSKLDEVKTSELISFLEENTFTKVSEICEYIFLKYQISYSLQGVYNWLIANGFSYKKPQQIPAKANYLEQKNFIKTYHKLKKETEKNNEPILFIDSVHPTMATKVSYGWIRTGVNKPIATTASRTRVNISGAIELKAMNVITHDMSKNTKDSVNGNNTVLFLKHIRNHYKSNKKIHIILDNSGYHKAKEVKDFADNNNINLLFLPPYSPNLNPIERLWKVMNEKVRNNYFFSSTQEFRQKINEFFTNEVPAIRDILKQRINDNFQIVGLVSSG